MANFRSFLKEVTVEPMLFLYYVAASTTGIGVTNLLLHKSCSPAHPLPHATECSDEESAQKVVTSINSWTPIVEFTIPVFFITFGGAWSDAHGKRRSPLMFLPIAGELITLFFLTSSVFFWQWSPEVTALFEALFRGLSGGRTCFSFGAITYIGDVTTPDQRTFRMAIVTALIFISTPLGFALGGFLRVTYGFYALFNVCIIFNIAAAMFGIFLLKPKSEPPTEKSCAFPDFLDTWYILVKERAGDKRLILLLILVVSPLFGGCLVGEYSIIYFFLRYKFHWYKSYGELYLAYRMSLTFFGTLFSIGILSKFFHLSDAMIGLLATTTQIISAVGSSMAQEPWEMFFYPSLDIMHGSIFAIGHSIISKVVDPSELGKVNSVVSAVDSVIPLIVIPLYNVTYNLTFEQFPGAFFLISVFFASISWLIFLTVLLLKRREELRIHTVIR